MSGDTLRDFLRDRVERVGRDPLLDIHIDPDPPDECETCGESDCDCNPNDPFGEGLL